MWCSCGRYNRLRILLFLVQTVACVVTLTRDQNEFNSDIVNEDKDFYSSEPVGRSTIIVPKKSAELSHPASIREMSIGYTPNLHGAKKTLDEHPTSSIVTVTTGNTTNSTKFSSENLKSSLDNLDKAAKKAKLSTAVSTPKTLNTSLTSLISNMTIPSLQNKSITENRTASNNSAIPDDASIRNSSVDTSIPVATNASVPQNTSSSLKTKSSVESLVNSSTAFQNGGVGPSSESLLSNHTNLNLTHGDDSGVQRDSSVITDSKIKGFLAKSENFTIKDVGKNGTDNGSSPHDHEKDSSTLTPLNVMGLPSGGKSLTNATDLNAIPLQSNASQGRTDNDTQASNFGYQQFNDTRVPSSNVKRMLHLVDVEDFVKKHVEAKPETKQPSIPSLEVVHDVTGTKKEVRNSL